MLLPAFALFAMTASAAAPQPRVEMITNQGKIIIALAPDKAPKTVENFLRYVQDGFYNGTIFHRVIDGFMIQGGGFMPGMKEKTTRPTIENEAKNGLKNRAGTLAMARRSDPHSASAQFFINVADNAFLDYPGHDGWGYAVFGKVVQGMDVVERIAKAKTGRAGPFGDVPTNDIIIKSVTLIQDNKP